MSVMDDIAHKDNMLGERIKRHRKALGLLQGQFPGVSRSALAMYEAGLRTPPPKKLAAIALVLGLRVEDLTETITQKTGNKWHRLAIEAYAAGFYRDAFRYARRCWNWATGMNDPLETSKASALVQSIAYHLTPDEMMQDEFDAMPYESLRGLIHWARLSNQWDFALSLSNIMIKRWPAKAGGEYWKAIRNRARFCRDIGHFKQSAYWYTKALEDPDLSFETSTQVQLAHHMVLVFDGRGNPDAWPELHHYATSSPLNWQMYWWTVTHHYWWTDNFDALEKTYHDALASYPPEWSDGYKLALSGIKAVIDWQVHKNRNSLEHLRHLLQTDSVDQLAGHDVMEDLWHDWLILAKESGDPQATEEWASYILHLVAINRLGFAEWFANRMPTLEPQQLPLSMGILLSRFRSRSTPWRDPLMDDEITNSDATN